MAADLSGADGLGCDLAGAWSAERVRQALAQLSADGFVKYDHAARVVFLPRALVYQAPENPNQRKAAIKSLLGLPRTPLLEDFLEAAQSHCPELAKELREQLAEPSREGIGESPAPAPAPAPTPAPTPAPAPALAPTPEEHLITADAAIACAEEEEGQGEAAAFSAFWEAYPRRVGRSEAKRCWMRLAVRDCEAATRAAGHLADFADRAGVELHYVPHPARFISKRTFEDWADGAPAGYASRIARTADEGPIPCFACKGEVTPDDIFEADYIEGRGWRHERCRERRTA